MALCYWLRRSGTTGMIGRLNEIGRCSVMEKYVAKTKVLRISRQASPVRIMIDNKKALEHMKYFTYLGSIITGDGRCTGEIKYRIVTAKAAFNE
jgi:hypothetical protein